MTTTILTWICEYWDDIFKWLGVITTTCTGIVVATPTKKDDNFWGKVAKIADYASIINTAATRAKLAKIAKKK